MHAPQPGTTAPFSLFFFLLSFLFFSFPAECLLFLLFSYPVAFSTQLTDIAYSVGPPCLAYPGATGQAHARAR